MTLNLNVYSLLLIVFPFGVKAQCEFKQELLCQQLEDECLPTMDCRYHPYPKINGLFSLKLIQAYGYYFLDISRNNDAISDNNVAKFYIYLKSHENSSYELCTINDRNKEDRNFVQCLPVVAGHTFSLEIEASRYLFQVLTNTTIFPYIEITQTSQITLRIDQTRSPTASSYTIEAFKVKNNVTTLEDVQLFDENEQVKFDLYTYNDEADFYFVISSLDHGKIVTPTVHIDRKTTQAIIGVVSAGFLFLPFIVVFLLLVNRQIKASEDINSENILIIYNKATFAKQTQIVNEINKILKEAGGKDPILIECRKAAKKLCSDLLHAADPYIVYVAPLDIDELFAKPTRKTALITFDYCVDDGKYKNNNLATFNLMADFDKLLNFLNISNNMVNSVNLNRIISEVGENLPKIVITSSSDLDYVANKPDDKLIENNN